MGSFQGSFKGSIGVPVRAPLRDPQGYCFGVIGWMLSQITMTIPDIETACPGKLYLGGGGGGDIGSGKPNNNTHGCAYVCARVSGHIETRQVDR